MDAPMDPYNALSYHIQFRHICGNASMTGVVLYERHDLLGNIHYYF